MIVDTKDDTSGDRQITIKWPRDANGQMFTIVQWVKTLPTDQQLEWQHLRHEHENMVRSAKSCGDAWVEESSDHSTIFWKSPEIHKSYLDRIPRENHAAYQGFWQRYLDYCNKRS